MLTYNIRLALQSTNTHTPIHSKYKNEEQEEGKSRRTVNLIGSGVVITEGWFAE